MKKNLFMVAAVALMVFSACNKEEINDMAGAAAGTIEFIAGFDAETKTTLVSGKTHWVEGDAISINGVKFIAQTTGETSKFVNEGGVPSDFAAPFTAIYPYNATKGAAEVAATQTVANGTFADEAVVSVAYIEEGNNLKFKHVSSVVMFQVATAGVSELVFESSKYLAGTINVNADASYSVSEGSKEITVKPKNGTFNTSETYYVSVLPTIGAEKQDFAIKTDGVTVKSGNVKFVRNTIADAKSIEVKYVYLKPSLVWNIASPRYAAYFFEGDDNNTWVDMTDADKDGVYSAVVPEGYTNLIYCRMNPKNLDNRWNKENESEPVWNQSKDLKVPTDDKRTYIGGVMKWDADGSWDTLEKAKSYRENAVYLKPNSNWKQSDAWFAAYLCNGSKGTKWLKMQSVDGTFYGVELPSDFNATNYKNIIFVRMNPANTDPDWGAKWNQSGDLACTKITNSPYNRCCAINNGQWDCGTNVTWTTLLK